MGAKERFDILPNSLICGSVSHTTVLFMQLQWLTVHRSDQSTLVLHSLKLMANKGWLGGFGQSAEVRLAFLALTLSALPHALA